jgi:hypothetical protein
MERDTICYLGTKEDNIRDYFLSDKNTLSHEREKHHVHLRYLSDIWWILYITVYGT